MLSRFFPAFAALMVLHTASPAHSAELFVAPTGNDQHPGSRAQPFKTLERARDEVRTRRAAQSLPASESATIWLLAGTHSLDKTFELDARDSGQAHAPLVIAAAAGETVRISGGHTLPASAFRPLNDSDALARIDKANRPHLLVADLAALGLSDYGEIRQFGHGKPVVTAPAELFWNDTPLTLARFPNEGSALMGPVIEPGSIPRNGDFSNRPGSFHYLDQRHARWVGVKDAWLHGFFHHGYSDDVIRIASIDPQTKSIQLAAAHLYSLNSGKNYNTYVAFNLLEELDSPGEWYLDREHGKLYVYPPSSPASAHIALSIVGGPLIAIENATDCHLRDLIIENGRGLGIYVEGGARHRIERCTIRNVGTVGIQLGLGARQTNVPNFIEYEGVAVPREVGDYHQHIYANTAWDRRAGHDHTIAHCEIYNTGSGGVILGGGSKKDLTPGNNVVTDCRISRVTRRNKFGASGVNIDGCGNRVVHCEIFDSDMHAIWARGNEHIVEFNHFHHIAQNANDASAWYLGRDPSDQGNIVRYNFLHDIGRPDRKWMMGIYCDDATCGVTIEGNVFLAVATYGSVYSNGGSDIIVRNNIFIGGTGPAFQQKSMWWDFSHDNYDYYWGPKSIYRHRLYESVDIRKPPYSTRYPHLVDWMNPLPDGYHFVGMYPQRNLFDQNVIVQYEETVRLVGEHAQLTFGDNYLSTRDPGFVDPANHNFNLKPDSPVFKKLPNFKPIPFDEIGPRKRPSA